MKFIRKDSMLYQYHLGFDTQKNAFLMTMRKAVYEEIVSKYIHKYIEIERFNEEFGLSDFSISQNKFGFMKCGDVLINNEDIVVISFPIIKDSDPKRRKLIALITTLSSIFEITKHLIDGEDNYLGEEYDQQAFISLTYYKEGFYAHSISADLSISFTKWIRESAKYENDVNELIATNCLRAFKKLTDQKGILRPMGLTQQGFIFSGLWGVYSSQFGVLPEEVSNYKEEHAFGYETFCHNTDTPVDQIVHLVGFATLMQFARENTIKGPL